MKILGSNRPNTIFFNVILALIYVSLYRHIHIHFLVEVFGYFGYKNIVITDYEESLTNLLTTLPIILYSGKKNASSFAALLIYIFIYVPTLIQLQYYYTDYLQILPYQLMFFISIILFFSADQFKSKLIKSRTNSISLDLWLKIAVVFLIICAVLIFPKTFHIPKLTEVYDVRHTANLLKQKSPFIGYITLWVSSFFIPLILISGLVYKNKKYIFIGIIGALIIYISTGSKASLFGIFFIWGFYYLLTRDLYKYLFAIVIALFFIVYVLYVFFGESSGFITILASIILMRTMSISGLLSTAYIDFFQKNEVTYYSHINIINIFTGDYRYGNQLGKSVWSGFAGQSYDEAMNANANFLLTDGIAGLGINGIFLISIIFFIFLLYLNRVSYRHSQNFVLLLLIRPFMMLLNASLFTAILSCGLLLAILFFRFTTLNLQSQRKISKNRAEMCNKYLCAIPKKSN